MKNRSGSAALARAALACAALACAALRVLLPAPADAGALHHPVPVPARCYGSPFGWRHRVGPMAPAGLHDGIDLPAPAGALVRAPVAGTVARIRRMGIGGLQVTLDHPGGLVTLYAHLGSVVPALAEGGTALAAGDPIGRIGRTGVTGVTHLFFAVLANGRAIDPDRPLGLPPC